MVSVDSCGGASVIGDGSVVGAILCSVIGDGSVVIGAILCSVTVGIVIILGSASTLDDEELIDAVPLSMSAGSTGTVDANDLALLKAPLALAAA
jgi:hypothetical protein